MSNNADEPKDLLEGFNVDMFRKTVCPKTDALVVFIPKDQEPSPEIKKVLDEAGPQRWFPKEDGNIVKCPNVVNTFDKTIFKLEKGGWDHEHCDACGNTIDAGMSCWIAKKDDELFLICELCYKKLKIREQP